jgi:hypothetical protein
MHPENALTLQEVYMLNDERLAAAAKKTPT